MLDITEDTNLHLRAGAVGKLHSATETLILLGIVVFQSNLELDGLSELARLFLRALLITKGKKMVKSEIHAYLFATDNIMVQISAKTYLEDSVDRISKGLAGHLACHGD